MRTGWVGGGGGRKAESVEFEVGERSDSRGGGITVVGEI